MQPAPTVRYIECYITATLFNAHRRSLRGPPKGVEKNVYNHFSLQKGQILCESLMFSNCECEYD